jgi:hypothetical protein
MDDEVSSVHLSYSSPMDTLVLLYFAKFSFLCRFRVESVNVFVILAKYLFRHEICSAGTYFTENLFCRNFLNEKLVPGTYFIGKFIPSMVCEICSGILPLADGF